MNRLLAILLFLLPLPTLAQSPLFNKNVLNINEINYKIKCLTNNADGYLFLGTDKGVFYYDGFHFVMIDINSNASINVNNLFFDSRNTLWVGDNDGHVYNYKFNSKYNSTSKKFVFKSGISDFVEDKNGKVWISTYGDGISYIQKDKIIKLNEKGKILDNYVYNLSLINNEIWYSTDHGIGIVNSSTIRNADFEFNKNVPDEIITSLNYDDKFSLLYIGTQSKGLYQYLFRNKKMLKVDGSERFGSIQKIIRNHNEVWMITEDSGLVHYSHEGNFKVFNKNDKGFISGISDVKIDKEGNFWICNQTNELYSFNDLFEILYFPKNFEGSCTAIYRDKNSNLWFSTQNKFMCYNGESFQEILPQLKKLNIVSINQDEYGYLWLGTFDKGLIRYNIKSKKYKIYTEKNGLSNNNILSIAKQSNTLWLATLGGVCKVVYSQNFDAPVNFYKFSQEKELGLNFIYQVFIDSKNNVWFATDGNGISVFNGLNFKNYSIEEGLTAKTIYSITEDEYGTIWINSARDGIFSFDGKKFLNFNRKQGIRNSENASLISDQNKNLLIVSTNSIDFLNVQTKQILYHDEELGLKDLDPGLNASYRDNYGNIWIGTSKGIIKYYSHLNSMWSGPNTILKNVSVFYESTADSLPKKFKYNENYLTFDYIGLWYHKPSEVKYKVLLEGYDIKWYETKDNTVTYSKLQPGSYTFKVMSSASNDFSNAKVVSYSFEITPPYYQRFWFISLVSIIILLLFYKFMKWRENRLKVIQRYENDRISFQLDTLRNQINPHFLFNSFNTLAGIIETDQDKAVLFVEKLSDFYRELLFYREKKLISLEEELKILKNYIFLIEQRFSNKILIDINVEEDLLNKMIAPLSLQLLMENAIKHNSISRENPLTVSIYIEEGFLIVKNPIQKKNEEVVSMGIGLQNIKSRYQLLSTQEVVVESDDKYFKVKIPLID